ncbi:MAG: signal recognition particle protein [Rickettsiaceae bacterium]|nr:signal recognition particle protein [Rickettsiaceae bacterium]
MFKALTDNLTKIFDKIRSTGTISEAQINESMRDIRIALLEADVSLPVIKEFIENIKIKAQGAEIIKSVSPGQMIIKIIHNELISLLSSEEGLYQLNLNTTPPANILLVGLQGSGKTTASAKLALKLKQQNKKVLLVSLDIYRPAAQEQLEILAKSIGVDSLPIIHEQKPSDIVQRALREAKLSLYDVVIYDSAGRLHIDHQMIDEVKFIKQLINPVETLLVIDSMMGQDSITVATKFNQELDLSGVILSRIDGDSKGGAALSVKSSIKKPIKFLSTGEKLADLENFDPERIASRILDMGDIVSLVEKASSLIDKEKAQETADKLKKGNFDLNDYIAQIKMIRKLGGFGSIMKMIPGISKITNQLNTNQNQDKLLNQTEAIVLSMTKKERKNPDLLNASRKKRIASGSGTNVQQVNMLIQQYTQISKMLKKASKMDQKSFLRSGFGKFFS